MREQSHAQSRAIILRATCQSLSVVIAINGLTLSSTDYDNGGRSDNYYSGIVG